MVWVSLPSLLSPKLTLETKSLTLNRFASELEASVASAFSPVIEVSSATPLTSTFIVELNVLTFVASPSLRVAVSVTSKLNAKSKSTLESSGALIWSSSTLSGETVALPFVIVTGVPSLSLNSAPSGISEILTSDKLSLSASLSEGSLIFIAIQLSSAPLALPSILTVSLSTIGLTSTFIVEVVVLPSAVTVYVKLSCPLKSSSGVYVTTPLVAS